MENLLQRHKLQQVFFWKDKVIKRED